MIVVPTKIGSTINLPTGDVAAITHTKTWFFLMVYSWQIIVCFTILA